VRHAITNRRITVVAFEGRLVGPLPAGADLRWIRPDELSGYGVSSLCTKVVDLLAPRASRTYGKGPVLWPRPARASRSPKTGPLERVRRDPDS